MTSSAAQVYTDDERPLAALEPAWGDFARRLRTGQQVRGETPTGSVRARGLKAIHAEFEYFHEQFNAGDKAAIIRAMRLAAAENVPMPYWLADGFVGAMDELFASNSATMADVFGMQKYYPDNAKESPQRAAKARRDVRMQTKLYGAVHDLMAGGMGQTAAIKKAAPKLGIGVRVACDWFKKVNDRQQAYIRATSGRKLHKLR